MITTPLVTIGIPTYNVGSSIALSIQSVLSQTYTNFELLITDDGSTDNTIEEIKKFNDPRIILLVDGENQGISYRLNQQIDMAKGDVFVRMDGDDIMFPTRIEEEMKYLKEHPDIDVVGSSVVVIDVDNKILGCRFLNNNLMTRRSMYASSCFAHPTVCGRVSFFRKYHYRSEFNGCEDHNLWIRGFNGGNYHNLSVPLMFYRDPYVFKLETYLGRVAKIRDMYRELKSNDKGNALFLQILICKTYVRSAISYVLSKLHLDSIMIRRRNQPCDNPEFQNLLNKILDM